MWLLCVDTFSSAPSTSSAISHYREFLEIAYKNSPISPDSKWPPSPSRKFITLAMVEGHVSSRDEYIGHRLQGNIKQVLNDRKTISIGEIFEIDKGRGKSQQLVLIEGAPGIGKSVLAWELCRKYMRQYSLVVLLRLREVQVQNISTISQLFFQYESEDKKLVEEVAKSGGRDILFILDGFNELPKTLQQKSFLLELMKGYVLPGSSVLVTSRPSATAELRTSCLPQKHIEILGFTQESVEAYASSVFSSEPEKLKKFMAFISASKNPAINSLMYIPLNAAIIVKIYLNCKSDALLPLTLTEVYTLLSLTLLNRDLHPLVMFEKLEDLPADLYVPLLHLSQIAFEGILNEEVIFHTLPPDLVHFGFLDAVPALYEGGRVSYNFLHLTLQEFFAAYHISHLGSSGLEVFKQYGKDRKWNIVWRFVAGLTKFEHNESQMDSDLFIKSRDEHETEISLFSIHCLFEAQSIDYFSPIFRSASATWVDISNCTPLEMYMIDFCNTTFDLSLTKKNKTDFITSNTGMCIITQ